MREREGEGERERECVCVYVWCVHVNVCVCLCVCVCVQGKCMCMHMCMRAYMHMYTQACTCVILWLHFSHFLLFCVFCLFFGCQCILSLVPHDFYKQNHTLKIWWANCTVNCCVVYDVLHSCIAITFPCCIVDYYQDLNRLSVISKCLLKVMFDLDLCITLMRPTWLTGC